MTQQKRYADQSLERIRERWDESIARPRPVQIPQQAYGPTAIEWAPREQKPAVWAWVPFTDGQTRRLAGYAIGWNDRVVLLELPDAGGWQPVVWRTAVSVRTTSKDAPSGIP